MYVGASGGTGNATVSGINSTLTATGSILVGYNATSIANTPYGGNGTLALNGGASLVSANAIIGGAGGNGFVSLTDQSTSWTNSGTIYLGQDNSSTPALGTGTLSIGPGTTLQSANLTIASGGTYSQSGGNSTIASLDASQSTDFLLSGGNMTLTSTLSPPTTLDFYINSPASSGTGPTLTLNGASSTTFSKNIFIGDLSGRGTYVGSGANSSLTTTSGVIFVGVGSRQCEQHRPRPRDRKFFPF